MYKFIYVFTKETSDELVTQGFNLVKSDKKNKVYVFENNPKNSLPSQRRILCSPIRLHSNPYAHSIRDFILGG